MDNHQRREVDPPPKRVFRPEPMSLPEFDRQFPRFRGGAGHVLREAEAAGDAGPVNVVLLQTSHRPSGGGSSLRVRLRPGGTGAAEVLERRPTHGDDPDEEFEYFTGGSPLPAEECDRVSGAAREAAAAGPVDRRLRAIVCDGRAAAVVVWERGRGVVLADHYNLSSPPTEADGHAVVRLMRLLDALAQTVPTTKQL